MNPARRAERYARIARRYLSNVGELAARGEAEKAGEILWGAVVLAVKTGGARRERQLPKYAHVAAFVRELAHELQKPDLLTAFRAAEALHGRFYEGDVSVVDVLETRDAVRPLLGLLLAADEPDGGKVAATPAPGGSAPGGGTAR